MKSKGLPMYKIDEMDQKEKKKYYNKRRKLLKTGHCVRCGHKLTETRMNCKYFPERDGELIGKGGIMKDHKCPNCETDLMEFCFKDLMDEAKAKAKVIVKEAKDQVKKKVTKKSCKKKTVKQESLF
jgi:hypothetical protein